MEPKSEREVLRDKVVDLVKEFIKNEGGITLNDLHCLFGFPSGAEDINGVASAIANKSIVIDQVY